LPQDLARYHRQMLLPGFGEAGQRKLLASTVLVLGCGALGTVSANMLARAGVGRLVIVDRDFVDLTNLQRQVLFDEQDVADGVPKAEAARRKIARINSQVEVIAVVDDINSGNIEKLVRGVDLMIDGLDNLETRYLANDCAVKFGIPYLYGGAVGTAGLAFAILPHTPAGDAPWESASGGEYATPCLRCLFEEPPTPGQMPTCDTVGVLGTAVSVVANFQATEAMKILTGNLDRVSTTLLNIDLWTNSVTQLNVSRAREQGNCPCCKQHDFAYLEGRAGSRAASLCGSDAVQLTHRQGNETLDLSEVARRLEPHGSVRVNEFMARVSLRDNDAHYELTLFKDGRAIVKGTRDPKVARNLYARYIGT
jgi:molybdopterin/thiamine biosynthesis adenylyltransferase